MTKTLTPEAQAVHLEVMHTAKKLLQTPPTQDAMDAAFSIAPMAIVLQQAFEGIINTQGDLDSPDALQLSTYLVGEFANFPIEVITQSDVEADPLGVAKKAQDQTAKVAELIQDYTGDKALEHSAFAGVAKALISYYSALREEHGENKVQLVGNLAVAVSVLFTDDGIEELVDQVKEIES